MKYLSILFLLITAPAWADVLTWIEPTEREDNTPLAPDEIAGYNIYNDAGSKVNDQLITQTSYEIDRIRSGPQTLFVRTLDTDGRESANSIESVVIPQLELAPPKPPSMFDRVVARIKQFFAWLLLPREAKADSCYRECAAWDTFCKSPPQIVATKCRLGVPVYNETCAALGIDNPYVNFRYSLVEGLPCSSIEGRPTKQVITDYL